MVSHVSKARPGAPGTRQTHFAPDIPFLFPLFGATMFLTVVSEHEPGAPQSCLSGRLIQRLPVYEISSEW